MVDNHIFQAIKASNQKMHSKRYFLLQSILVAIAILLTFVLIIIAVSFIIFALEQNGGFLAAGFGLTGWAIFFRALPWSVVLLSLALILVMLLMLKRYPFVYKQPGLYLLLILIIVIALGSFFIEAINLHRRIEENNIPVIGSLYQYETTPANFIYRGKVIQLVQNGFVLQDLYGNTSTFIAASGTTLNVSGLAIGDHVLIFGEPEASATLPTISIYGIENMK